MEQGRTMQIEQPEERLRVICPGITEREVYISGILSTRSVVVWDGMGE